MDASSNGTHGESRRDAEAPGAWQSDMITGAPPRAAARCPAPPPSSTIPERAMPTEPADSGEPRTCSDGARRAIPDARSNASAPRTTDSRFDPRTRLLLEAPIAGTLLRLAAPNVLVMVVQAAVGLIETYFIGKLGTEALAGVALVFPVVMLMQMMSAGAMGGGISSAVARALGAGRRADAEALVLHALAISVVFGLGFMLAVLGGGHWLWERHRKVAVHACPSIPMHAGREERRGGTVGRVWSSRGAQQGVARCTHAGPWLESNLFVTLPEPLRGLLVPMAIIFDVLQTATN